MANGCRFHTRALACVLRGRVCDVLQATWSGPACLCDVQIRLNCFISVKGTAGCIALLLRHVREPLMITLRMPVLPLLLHILLRKATSECA